MRFDPQRASAFDLSDLAKGMPGITPRVGAYLAEAATVCLEEQRHRTGVALAIDGDCNHRVQVLWSQPNDDQQRTRAWADPDEATEQGACGIAALLVDALTDYTILERARKGPGFDYWLGKKGSASVLFQDKARLEVSGIRSGDEREVARRVRQKTKQIQQSNGILPGVVAVVEFGTPRSRVKIK